MATPYSQDLRDRVLDAIEKDGMSRMGAAERFEIDESSAIKWMERLERTGSRTAAQMGGYKPRKLDLHREVLEAARAEKPGVTLQALCDRLLAERGVKADTSMMSRFFRRIGVTPKKKTLVAREQDRPDISRYRRRWKAYQGLIDPKRLVFIDETWTKTNMTRLRGWAPRCERLIDKVPRGRWKTPTFLAALRNDRLDAPCGRPQKRRNDSRSRTASSAAGSERVRHCFRSRIVNIVKGG
jgi:transposase